jgi:tRNA (mo5U34)-methyltransferase
MNSPLLHPSANVSAPNPARSSPPLPKAGGGPERNEIERRVRELGTWFHNLNLRGVQTAPDHFLGDYPMNKWRTFAHCIPSDLRGQTVLDVGCNAGFYSIEMKRRGADRVLGIDFDPEYLAQARLAAEINEVEIEFRQLSVYDVAALGEKFDLVLFMGVFYHLRHPLLALDLLQEHVVKDLLVFQSMQRGSSEVMPLEENYHFWEESIFDRAEFPRMFFIERKYAGDPTNWWIPNRACVEALLRSAGFEILSHPEQEVFICRRQPEVKPSGAVYPAQRRSA